MLTGLPALTCSLNFLNQPSPTFLGIAPITVVWVLLHQLAIKKWSKDMSRGQLLLPKFVKLTTNTIRNQVLFFGLMEMNAKRNLEFIYFVCVYGLTHMFVWYHVGSVLLLFKFRIKLSFSGLMANTFAKLFCYQWIINFKMKIYYVKFPLNIFWKVFMYFSKKQVILLFESNIENSTNIIKQLTIYL